MNLRKTLVIVTAFAVFAIALATQSLFVRPPLAGAVPLAQPTEPPPPPPPETWLVAYRLEHDVGDGTPKTWYSELADAQACYTCPNASSDLGDCSNVALGICTYYLEPQYILWKVDGVFHYNYPDPHDQEEYSDSNYISGEDNGYEGYYWWDVEEAQGVTVYHSRLYQGFLAHAKVSHWEEGSDEVANMHYRHPSQSGCWHDSYVQWRWAEYFGTR